MNIALMSHDNKKELMVQFCTAYAGILSHHNIYATNTTGHMVADATGLNVHCFLSYAHGGSQQIGARIAYNEFDLVLFFNDPNNEAMVGDVSYISRLCDQNNILRLSGRQCDRVRQCQQWYSPLFKFCGEVNNIRASQIETF